MNYEETLSKKESKATTIFVECHKPVKAPQKDTPIVYLWDFENITVPQTNTECFLEAVRSHLLDFQEISFFATASLAFLNKNVTSLSEMHKAWVDVLCVPAGKDKADDKLKQKAFQLHRRHPDYWFVLITGDSGFHEMCNIIKNLVLIYDDRQESPKVKKMADDTSFSFPVSNFLTSLPPSKKRKQSKNKKKGKN